MQALQQLLERLKSYSQALLYNRKVVDPYLLASRGLVFSSKIQENGKRIAVGRCSNPHCSLLIEFDTLDAQEESKDGIETAVADHDAECPFSNVTPIKLDASLFRNLGHLIFQKHMDNIQDHQKFIQLSPKQVKQALGLSQVNQTESPHKVNITLEMFRKLDRRLSGERLLKVRSAIFLALFGWQFSSSSQNQTICRFCNTSRNVFQFLSPSESTLMGLPVGFDFISAHRPWCCLVREGQPLWRQILKQVVLRALQSSEGQVSRNQSEMRCKEIQDNAVRKYANQFQQWIAQRRKLQELKVAVQMSYSAEEQKQAQLRRSFLHSIHDLQGIFDTCKQSVETFIKRIKLS